MPTANPRFGLGELALRTDAGLVIVHDSGPAQVESVVLHEPDAQQRIPSNAVILAVGFQAGDPRFAQLVADAAQANAVAVVAKPSSIEQTALQALGEQHAISTILLEQSADWLVVASRLRSAAAVSSVDAVAGIRVGDLFAFANAVALATGGATAIVDPAGRLLAFSNLADQPLDELRRRATLLMAEQDSPAQDPDYLRLYAAPSAIHIAGTAGGFDRIAVAVRSDREILGSIWVLTPPGQNQDRAERALLELVESAAVHLHHARAELDIQRSRHSQQLQALLTGQDSVVSAAALGLPDRAWFRLAILGSGSTTTLSRPQVHSVSSWLNIIHGNARFAEINSRLVILFSGTDPADWRYIERSLETFLRNSDALRATIAVAISSAVTRAEDLSGEFSRLQMLARVATVADASPIIRMDDHWARVELAMIAEAYARHDSARLSVLTEIRDYDHEHHSDYWTTLRAYVLSDRSFNDAAAGLNVHANTVRYRIDRLKTMFNLDLSDPATFFWVAVQVHHPAA